jgi:transcriptional regulator with XRE-family HTH domain
VSDVDPIARSVLLFIAATVLEARRARGWTQARLARAAAVSQTLISAIERCAVPDLPVSTSVRVLRALDIPFDLRLARPLVTGLVRDAAHARCVAYTARRLEAHGFLVKTEVEVHGPGWFGFIDVLAFHPGSHILLVIDLKTELWDLGELQRQLVRYERTAWDAARALGWRARSVTGGVLLLATDANDRRMATERAWFDREFTVRHRELMDLVDAPRDPPARGRRAIAMIDPRTRRRAWLLPTWLDHRRRPAAYADRAAFIAGRRAA